MGKSFSYLHSAEGARLCNAHLFAAAQLQWLLPSNKFTQQRDQSSLIFNTSLIR